MCEMTFAEYLQKTGQTVYAFFKANDLPKNGVYKAYNGKPVEYQTAKRILAATGNEVSLESLLDP